MMAASRKSPSPHHSLSSNLVRRTTTRGGTRRIRKIDRRFGRLSMIVRAGSQAPGILCHARSGADGKMTLADPAEGGREDQAVLRVASQVGLAARARVEAG